ncbi:MAG: hypothetical protein GY749_29780 [Desulfobacteraceae bacterium]|nr:hypothetical protein [Desulfobacteraceae bacterium]
MNKVILFIIDVCRTDALDIASTPYIDALTERGSHTFSATTVTPPLTLPIHFSIFTSLKPMSHGIITNVAQCCPPVAWRIMDLAKYNGKTTAAFHSWDQLHNLWRPRSADYILCMNPGEDPEHDLNIAEAARSYISLNQPDFCFIYLERTDKIGHEHGFMSDAYISEIEKTDRAVGIVQNDFFTKFVTARKTVISIPIR